MKITKVPDPEQIRLQLICAALNGILSNPEYPSRGYQHRGPAEDAVRYADAVIYKLEHEDGL